MVRKTVLDYPSRSSLTTCALKVEDFLQLEEEEIREVKQKENKNKEQFKDERDLTRCCKNRPHRKHKGCGKPLGAKTSPQLATYRRSVSQSYTHKEVRECVCRSIRRAVLTAALGKACLQGWPIPKTLMIKVAYCA